MSRLFGAGVVAVVVAMMVGRTGAGVVQVTNLPAGAFCSGPTMSGDGRLLTFTSSGNLGGLNPTPLPNVFVYDLLSGLFTRITANTGFDPVISTDGRWIAFTSGADYAKRNADGSDEIFRYDRMRKRFIQLTKDNNGDGSSELAAISGDGKRVAFETSSNLRRRNADFSNEVYLFNRSGNTALSIDPEGDGESHNPALSGDGKLVAFVTTSNLTGRNDDFSQELMIYDVAARDLSQATNDMNGDGESSVPAVSGDGHFVTFISSSNVAGLNPDNSSAVYLRSGSGHFSVISQTAEGVFDGDVPTINDDGHWIFWPPST